MFVTFNHLYPSPIFASKAGRTCLALPSNVRLGEKQLTFANTLAYRVAVFITDVKVLSRRSLKSPERVQTRILLPKNFLIVLQFFFFFKMI